MAEVTAKDVKSLRDATGAGMMDCKKALTEAEGDMQRAAQILRQKGLSKVATLEAFYKQVWQHANPDDEIQLTVLQGAEIKTLTLKAVDRMSTMLRPAGI